MKISSKDAASLPLHDAAILGVTFPSLENGFDAISIRIKVNSEERRTAIRNLGIEGSEFWLLFEGCYHITANLIGYCSGRETISTLDLVEPSDLKENLRAESVSNVSEASHFRIEGSHGSVLDILAQSTSIEEV